MPADSATYQLRHEPDGTSWVARENLADVLRRELLGPADGDDEVIEAPPDSRYLVGRIAPVRLSDSPDSPVVADAEDDSLLDLGDDLAAAESRGVPALDVDDTATAADEDSAEDQALRRGLMIPASMGLRFQVPLDLPTVTVRASWGTYDPKPTGEVTTSGRSIRKFARTQHDVPTVLNLARLRDGVTGEVPLKDDVTLRVDAYTDAKRHCRLVELALCNDRETPRQIPVNAWLFQTELVVEGGGAEVFLPVRDVVEDAASLGRDPEQRLLDLQYRDRLEFAIGRTCSATWLVAEGSRRATRVSTTWLPEAETPQTLAADPDGVVLDMVSLSRATPAQIDAGLRPVVAGYAEWLAGRRDRIGALPTHLRQDATDAVEMAEYVQRQLADGLDFLLGDDEALRCFAFMNRVMADQRIHTQIAELRAEQPQLSRSAARQKVLDRGPGAHSWRTFQIAFVLMQIRALCEPETSVRSGDLAQVELLFFPTGGGKTEAYLGLAAFAFAIRRRQGVVDSPDGPLDGRSGVTVLMRYTLRLLTAQQFQRATTLVCAAEMARREDEDTWGTEPFRIGLWVGSGVSPKRVDDAAKELKRVNEGTAYKLTALQIQRCPWCGSAITAAQVRVDETTRRVHVYCSDPLAQCPFAEGGTVEGGVPVLTVDEEIYRLAPAFVIATVDKFARLAREGEAASLFGYVSRRCARHGFVHPDYQACEIKDGGKHPAKAGHPAAPVSPHVRLRPPDLIIQDELHLITGALGTTVGLFEVAIDALTRWRDAHGRPCRPLVVASSATVRNAADQVRNLYGRATSIFPPQVLDAGDTFFSAEVPVSAETPGRRYIGVSTTGVRMTNAEIRLAEVMMAGAQLMLDRCGSAADPYMTLVGYFSSTRELAGMTRYLGDDVRTALAKGRPGSGLPRRFGTAYGDLNSTELTARVSGTDITTTLNQMAVRFDPDFDSTQALMQRRDARQRGEKVANRPVDPYDTVLATSMLQVGVDVTRLGLMLMVGQPKNTAEYIQASSRVGRDTGRAARGDQPAVPGRPGLVVTLGNWARPRDLAHFEQFRHYHETFYARVEALSVTPFSETSMERGLDGVLVSAARVVDATRTNDGLSPERSAGRVSDRRPVLTALIDAMVDRITDASDETSADFARQRLLNRLDTWEKRRTTVIAEGKSLAYERINDTSQLAPLLRSAENTASRDAALTDAPFVVANSMREVQPEINLLVSPDPSRLHYVPPVTAPTWTPQPGSTS